MRKRNTNSSGGTWTEKEIKDVWSKAFIVSGQDKNKIRKDICGALIQFNKHGETTSGGKGWEIDHKKPVAKGGSDVLSNLQPLQWENNRKKGDEYPASNYCVVMN